MILNRRKNTIRGVVFGYLSKIISVLFPFAIKTIIINILGVQYLGLNALFSSVLNILNLAELGFGSAMVFSMYKPIEEDDTETINALLNLYRKLYRIIGIIVLTVGLAVMPLLPYLIKKDCPTDINIYTLYLIYLANNVIGYFFFAYKTSLLAAHQRNDVSSKINIIVQTLMYVCQIAVLFLFKNYYVYIIFLPLSTLGINLYTAHVTKKMFPQYFCKGALGKEIKSDIKKKISALITHKIGYVIQSSIDQICISAFMGEILLGRYSNYMYIITAIEGFITIIKQSMLAGIGNSIIVETAEYNKKQFYKHLLFYNWITAWCCACFLCLFQPFIGSWLGGENVLAFTVVICLTFMFYCSSIRSTVSLYKDALGMWWEDRFKPIAISLVNLVGTIISAYFGFFEGIILTTAVAYLLVGMPWETHVFFKNYMKEKPIKYYAKQVFNFVVALSSIALTYFICTLIPLTGIEAIVVRFLVCLVVPNVIMFVVYYLTNQFDRKNFNKGVKNFMGKIKNKVKKIYYSLPWNPASYDIKVLNKKMHYYQKLNKKYSRYIDESIKCENKNSNYVFTCWLQGEENAPDLVKTCFASMRKQFKDKKLVIITTENIKEYVELPEFVMDKWKSGKITNTHFSDILRAALLAKHGGLWIDATVLCTGGLDRYVEKDSDLFVFSNEFRGDPTSLISSWFIYAKPNNPIIVNTRNLLYKYWEKNNKLKEYYLFHLLFTVCANHLSSEWKNVKFSTNLNPHMLLFLDFYNEYDEERMEELKQISNFHKLTYKVDKSKVKENSFYEKICRGGGVLMSKIKGLCWKFKKLFSLVFYLFPINKKKVTVYNFNGLGYGDNPRYLVEELIKENKYKIIWIVKDKTSKFPDGVKKVGYKSLSSLFHMITARLWLDTSRYSPRPIFKRKNQYYIQMWHGGIPLKGMEKDAEETLSKSYIESAKKDSALADFMLSNCKMRTEIIERAFWFDGKILEYGIPRDDILFNPRKADVDEFKKKYGLENKKIALYAPTFRQDRNFYNNLSLNLSKVKEALSKKFNADFEICIKLHPNDADLKDLPIFNNVVNLTSEPDSQMILSASDVVISDYSSMLLDFTLTKRFAITFAPDFEQYKSKERHLYFDLKTCGIPFASNENELLKIINDFDPSTYKKNIQKFLDYFGVFEKGDSSYLIKKYLIENGILK